MTVERAAGHSRQRGCPACGAPTVMLPLFTSRRRKPVACTNCGQRLEVVYPRRWYYALALVSGVLLEFSVLPLMLLLLLQKWGWVVVFVGAGVITSYLTTAFLNSRATVEVDELDEVSRKEVFGRWYPK